MTSQFPTLRQGFPKDSKRSFKFPSKELKRGLLYQSFPGQSAALFYSLVKEHPFLNGNKRIAVVSLLTLLYLNGRWLSTDWKTLYGLTVFVANSDPSDRAKILKILKQFIKDSLIGL